MTGTRTAVTWMTLPRARPVSTEPREIDIVRKRLMRSSVVSVQTDTAVAAAAEVADIRMMPGAT
ncbi:hypothetical protein [Streptomyces chattanoogensis]|uniref:hypothetical protein n=1 Tax=Streptomyces chattanoogensis TaxID=66876 RepID=UPI00369189E2